MICAPPLTWRRAISVASSQSPAATRSRNFREPMTLVRSPTSSGRLSGAGSTSSMPENAARRGRPRQSPRGRRPATIRAIAAMWSAVVPQQPPTMLIQPESTKRSRAEARLAGDSG